MSQDKKQVNYVDRDVLTEAKTRIKHVIDIFDHVFVAFSGGKDSLVTLTLVEEVWNELGRKDKINVIFRDEELIPDDVINFVQEKAKNPIYNFRYFAVQMASHKFILGRTLDYVQWDDNRKWIRPKPAMAITELPGAGKGKIFSQYDMDYHAVYGFAGKCAMITGIRADESLIRYRSCINKRNENYINATEAPNVKLVKPIYDWSEKDVFKYLWERKVKYCTIYDKQTWNGQRLRVSTPIHAESSKELGKLKTLYPVFYEQLMTLFPEMLVQERYWKSLDRYAIIYKYPKSWQGIRQYIMEQLPDDHQQKLAIYRLETCMKLRGNQAGGTEKNFYGYPMLYVFKCIVAGQYKRVIQPCKTPSQAEIIYENG